MSKRNQRLLLDDILLTIDRINGISFDEFLNDSKTSDDVIRNFEVKGEGANRLPGEVKEKYPEIDWYRICGFRNRIVHDYICIDYQMV